MRRGCSGRCMHSLMDDKRHFECFEYCEYFVHFERWRRQKEEEQEEWHDDDDDDERENGYSMKKAEEKVKEKKMKRKKGLLKQMKMMRCSVDIHNLVIYVDYLNEYLSLFVDSSVKLMEKQMNYLKKMIL